MNVNKNILSDKRKLNVFNVLSHLWGKKLDKIISMCVCVCIYVCTHV